jgi:hypothetical protein
VYDATGPAQGFSSATLEAITLEVGQSKTLNFQLRPGEVKESITVTDAAPLITVNRPAAARWSRTNSSASR